MQQLRQHTFGCGHCALCVAAKSVFALFAGFLTLALTFASTLILSSVLFTSTAFAQVNAENSGSAASAQTAATTQNASNKTAGQSDSAATANAGNTSEKANAALATNSASTSKNAGSAAASGASSTAQNAANNGAANAGQEAANNSNSQANPKTFSITYIVDGKSATTDGVAGTIKLATLESKTVNGVSYTFLGWKLEDGTLLKGGTDFEMTKDVTLTAEWKVESANGSTSIDTITDQDSSNSAINGENPGQGDLPETDNGNKGPDAPDYVVLPNEGESNSQVNDGNSSSNSQVTNTTPPQNQGGTATSPGNSGTTLPNSSGSSVSSSNNSNSSSAKDLTASPNAPPVNAPKNSSISAASESNKANLAAQATPTENPFSATLKNVFWSWDPVSGTLTIGNIGTNTATINIGAFTASTLPWLTAADGAAPQAIKHIVTKQNAYGGGITCDSFESWFENYTALVSFNGMGLVVTNSTSFARMFKGCVSLTSITGISGWHAEQATDYSEMFAGCSSLESIDLSVFVTADKPASGSGTVTRNRTNMLAGMTSLKQIRLGTMTSLVDTGLDAISSRTDKLGVWDAEDKVADEDARWSGTSSQLIARYPVTGGVSINNALITDIIDYIFHPRGTFDSNNKVNWDFNTTTSTLTIFASDSALPNETLVTEAVMPWLDAIDKNSVKYVSFLTQNTGGQNLSKVLFSTLAGVFEGYVNLITFDGSGLNTTRVNDFSNLFKGDTALTTISLSGWSMRDQRDAGNLQISGMFEGCNALSTLTLGKDVVLFVSATNHAGVDGLYGRGDNDGVWERTDSKTSDPWFGTSANLEKRYSSGTPYVDRGDAVYTFTTAYRGGRFENDNTWWKYTVGANQKTLTIGADLLEPGETGDYRIARIERADLPWLKLVNGQPIVDVTQITYITTVGSTVGNMVGQAAPEFMAHWFEGFTSLINFNGSNLNTQYCTDFTDLFKGDTKLISINLAGWDTSASSIATRAGMFDGCDALLTLTVGPKVELTGTGLEALANHTTDDGTWVRQDSTTDSWMGSSENLVNRYNGPTSEGAGLPDEPAIYYFDDSILRNVFQSNANVWWQFDKDEKTLTIGVNMAGGNIAVDETYDLVPWLAVLGKGTADPAATARAMIEHIDFKQLVQVLNPAMWFKDYVNLADAYVANLGISQATSIASIFQGCGKLKILNGLGSWDPSNVTNMSHAFDGANFTDPGALENWNNKVGKVTDLSYIFANNGNVTTLECIKDWILSSATNFAYAFANCSRLVSLDISGWDMGKATTAASRENMLYGLDRLNTLVLSNTSNLNNTGLGLTDSTVTRGDTNGTWEANRVTNTLVGTAENAWFGTSEDLMRRYDPTRYPMGFNLGDDITYTWKPGVYGGRMPDAEPGNPYEDLWWKFVKGTDDATGRNTGTLTIGTDAAGGTNLTLTPDTAPWVDLIWRIFGDADAKAGLSHVTHFVAQAGKALTANLLLSADSLTGLFAANLGYTGLTRFTGTGFDVSNVTSLAHLFDGTSTLVQVLGIDGWKTGNVTDLSYMFAGNSKLTTITSLAPDGTKGTWDVHNVRNFSHMFEGCSALTELTAFNNWAVSAGSNFAYMFSGCTNLTTLDIWAWDMSNATSLDHMLADLESITTLGVGSKTALTGAAFEDIATRQKKNGSWDRQGSTWFGNTQNIVLLYPANVSGLGNALGDKIYYTWAEGILRGRFESNDNAYWSVTWNGTPWTATGILTIGIDNPAGNRVVTETWEQTPWTEALSTEGTRDGSWYNGGTLVTNNATLTVTKNPTSGLFETATYTAHFSKLGDITYTIEHYFEQADGSYAINNGLTGSGSGQEGSRVDKTSAMEQDVKGYSYKAGITGEKLFIASLQPGSADNVLRLYYTLNENAVDVAGTAPGADAPATVPVPTYPSTGITGAHTNHKYGTTLVLPDMPNVSGWDFSWTITSTDPDFVTRTGVANGATFTMPDGAVSITGVWKRALHEVQFVAGADPHGTVSVKAPATLPFYVEHGKKMTEPGSTGHYGLIEFTEDTGWALAGWRYLDPTDGQTKDTTDPNSVVINANTVFTAIWAQTFYVAYDPGSGPNNHGGTGFTTLQRGGTDIGLGVNVSTLPLIIGGADRTQNAPAADGYKFIGWTWKNGGDFYWLTADATAAGYDTTGLGTAAQMNFTVERNITFTAIWEAIEQTLTYKIDGDNSPASNWTNMGKPGQAGLTTEDYVVNPKPRTDEVVTLLTGGDVERTGYTLAGWKYTDKDGITHTINGSFTMPAYAVTLTPVWDFAGLKIYFDYANGCDNTYGGLDKFSVNIDAGNASAMHIDGATASAYTGYKFMGWYEDADHTIKVDGYAVDGNHFIGDGTNGWTPKTYYAWFDVSETTYVIEFNLQTTTGFNTFERTFTGVTTGSTVDVEAAGNKAYTDRLSVEAESAFASYVFDPTHANSELVKVVMADGTTKLILFYNMLPFDITYDKDLPDAAYTWDWVSEAGPNKGTAEKTITIPSAKRDGYQFAGWTITYVDPVSGETVTTDLAGNTFIMPMAPVLVTAKWAQYMDVVIEYFKRGDVDPLGTETDRAIEGTTYTVSLDQIAAFKAAHMSELNGYRYIDDGKRGVVITSDPRHNVIQIFFDLINDFGVQFDKNYGDNRIIGKVEGMSLADMPYGSRPADPKRAGWVLDADKTWNTKADGTGLQLKITTTLDELLKAVYGDDYNADDFLKAGGILTLYAIWNQNDQFEVIYDMNNMKEKNPNILNDMPEWREDMAAEDKKGALWDQAGFNFKPIDKELSAPHGYEFVGWNTKADGTGHTITDATKYSEMSNWIDPNVEQMSITLYAMWKEIELDIEYLATVGGTVDRVLDRISAVTGQHVQTGSSPINPTERLHSVATAEAGYHFVRWELYDENKHAGLLRAMADGDSMTNILRFLRNDDEEIVVDPNEGRYYGARYIAIFEKNADATLVYDINGGTLGEIDSVTISHGLTTKLHNGVYVASTGKGYKRPYYTLVGWSTKPGEDNQVEYRLGQDYVMPEGGLTLYAVWQINSFPVDVDHRDDDLGKVDGGHADVVYGEKLSPEFIQSISQQPKNNSTFKGWHVTMTDSETGEIVFDQWVTDLNTLPDLLGPVVGPVSITADYEAAPEDLVTEGTTLPKTGDNSVLGLIIALVAGFALALIVLFARRRQDDDDDDDELRARRASAPAYAETIACAAAALRENPARIVRDAQSAAPTMFTLRKRNGRTRNTTHADGIAGTAISPATSFADSSLDSRNSSFYCVYSDTALADVRPVAFVRGAALSLLAVVLGCVVVFAPGLALATTGDPGTGSTSTASSHIQTNHSNTDPATSQTGSFQSKSAKAASASASSAKSSTNSASAPSSSASAGCRASKNTSAAPSKAAVSGSGSTLAASSASSAGGSSATAASNGAASESYSTRIATSDNIKRLAYLNALANRTSTYRASATTATASSASASTGAVTRTVGVSGVTSPSATGSAAAASVESAGIESAGASSAVPGSLPAVSDDSLAALGSLLSLKSSSDDSFAHTAAMFALRSTDQTQNDPNPNDGSGSGAAAGDVFDVPRSRASATDSDDAVINDPGEPPGKTDDSTIIYPDDPDPQPGDEPGGSSTDPGTDPVVPDEGDGVVDDPADDPAGERPDVPSDANDPADEPADNPADDATDAPVKIVYKAGEGGTVSYSSDKICSSTGTKLDENGKPTDKELVGPVAAPKVGYHFVGWAIDDPNVDSVDDLVMVTSDAALDAKTVKGCAFSDKANCYKAASFIALFKCNDYVFNYDANGGQLNTAGVQIEPTQATFGSNALFSTAASPARDGYKFLCWNTAASGLGAAIREGDALSAEKMRGMVIEAPVEDENGAAIQLYAQWTPIPADPTPIDPSELERPTQPVKPVVPTTPVSPGTNSNTSAGSNADTNANAGVSAGVTQPNRLVNTATADENASEETLTEAPLLVEDDALAALFAGIGAIGDAVVVPPALEVLPAATEEFVTRSAEAISGVPGTGNGQDASVGAVQAVGVATAAAGAIAIVLGVASAVSSTVARRRVVRALGADAAGGSGVEPSEPAGKAD